MIKNISTGKVLASRHSLCDSLWSQAKGLMFSKKRALVMDFGQPRKISLHMWFVFFPIDVIYLDGKKRVVEIKRNFLPFTLYTPSKQARYVVELPHPGGDETHIKDQIQF